MLSILLIVYNSFQRFYNLRFSANLSLKKPTILAPQTRLNDFSSNSLVPTERERVGRVGENPGNEVVHPNPWKFWNFLTCHYIFPLRIAGLIFFLSLSPYKDLYGDHLTVTQGGKSCFSCTSPFYFRFEIYAWNLQDIYSFICSYSSG